MITHVDAWSTQRGKTAKLAFSSKETKRIEDNRKVLALNIGECLYLTIRADTCHISVYIAL